MPDCIPLETVTLAAKTCSERSLFRLTDSPLTGMIPRPLLLFPCGQSMTELGLQCFSSVHYDVCSFTCVNEHTVPSLQKCIYLLAGNTQNKSLMVYRLKMKKLRRTANISIVILQRNTHFIISIQ